MGCDIHMFAEYKKPNGKWEADPTHKRVDKTEDDPGWSETLDDGGRDYNFFFALSGVRYGDVKPFTGEKCIPEDLSGPVQEAVDEWDGDAHSHTLFTLREYELVCDKMTEKYSGEEEDYWDNPQNGWRMVAKRCRDQLEKSQADAILLNEPNLAYTECRIFVFYDN